MWKTKRIKLKSFIVLEEKKRKKKKGSGPLAFAAGPSRSIHLASGTCLYFLCFFFLVLPVGLKKKRALFSPLSQIPLLTLRISSEFCLHLYFISTRRFAHSLLKSFIFIFDPSAIFTITFVEDLNSSEVVINNLIVIVLVFQVNFFFSSSQLYALFQFLQIMDYFLLFHFPVLSTSFFIF